MAKSKTASFVVELGLVTHQNEQVVLDKRFKIAEKLYNKVLYHAQTQLTELYKNHRYQDVLAERRLSIKAMEDRGGLLRYSVQFRRSIPPGCTA